MASLKQFRELKLKMSQKTLAEKLGIKEEELISIENDDIEDISPKFIRILADAVGVRMGSIYDYQPFETIKIKDNWSKNKKIKQDITRLVREEKKKILDQHGEIDEIKYVDEIENSIFYSIRKPRIALMGMSDAGKSSFINSIIGVDKMPVSWTPTTSIAVYIMHISDRPSFINDEALIFKFNDEEKNEFDINKLNDEQYCNKFKLASGNADILQKYGIRQGSTDSIEEAGYAIVYIDSDILRLCDIIDLPGFGTGDRENDDILSEKVKNHTDILVYMSQATGFLRGVDIEFLKCAIKSIPVLENKENNIYPLENLFIIGSQAHNVGNKEGIKDILTHGCSRLYNNIPDEIWKDKKDISGFDYSEEILNKRFYSYTTDRKDLRVDFEEAFKSLLEKLPSIILEQSISNIKSMCMDNSQLMGKYIEQLNIVSKEKENTKNALVNLNKDKGKIKEENKEYRENLIDNIENYKRLSRIDFDLIYDQLISVSNIESIISKKGYRKKKEDIDLLVGYINSSLESKLEEILKENSKKLSIDIDEYIGSFDKNVQGIFKNQDIIFSFDVKRLFAGGLAGAFTLGGLSVWASTLGNLGGYILVTKGVSILSAMGISIAGGTAAAVSAISAIGGPVSLGIALAILAALSIFSLFSGGWRRTIAEKIVKEYRKQDTKNKVHKILDKFWDDTIDAFNAGADNLEKEYESQVNKLYCIVDSSSDDKIDKEIKKYNDLIELFNKLIISMSL